MRLLEIRKDPLAHFVPTKVTPAGAFFCAGPPGLAPELEEMFMRPITNIMHAKRRGASPEKGGNKRARLDDENRTVDDIEVEQVRRAASLAPSDVLRRDSIAPPDISGGFDFGDDTGMNTMDDYQFDLGGEADIALKGAEDRARSKSRLSTPAAEGEPVDEIVETFADASCPIAFFDERQQSQTQTQSGENMSAPPEPDARGYSKNTVKALTFIRRELAPTPAASTSAAPQEKAISFNQVSAGATRRAASSFFFELLVLGTRDCVKLKQPEPFENIEVHAKDKLWERQRHAPVSAGVATPRAGQSQSQPYTNYSRASSVAASIA
jgi:cohesin complex subunit SCC1